MNEGDKHLLTLIRAGDQAGWSQFVARFQARLLAFAARQVSPLATAEDLVQDTFLGFLQSSKSFREQCELESFLFQILRRRIIDHYRRIGQRRELPACDWRKHNEDPTDPLDRIASQDLRASEYARRAEQQQQDELALAKAIEQLANELRDREKFRELKIAEGLFYAQLRSVELSQLIDVSENEIAVVKRRLIRRLAHAVKRGDDPQSVDTNVTLLPADLLTFVWETMRPSCPKRTTLGKFSLRILPASWDEFVRFHVETLACTFCNANLVELTTTSDSPAVARQHARIFNSTIGFLNNQP